jgi:competence transcription factor ComK
MKFIEVHELNGGVKVYLNIAHVKSLKNSKDGNAVVSFANDTFVILSESYEELKALIQD